jgi:hypothetical protein
LFWVYIFTEYNWEYNMPDLVNNSQDEKMKFLQGLILLAQEEGQHYGGRTKESSGFKEYQNEIMPFISSLNKIKEEDVDKDVAGTVNRNHKYFEDQQAPSTQYQEGIKNALACLQGEKNYQKFKIALEDVKRISQTRADYPNPFKRLVSEFFFLCKYGTDSPAQLLQKKSDAVLQAEAERQATPSSGGNQSISISQEVQNVPNVVCAVISDLRAQKELDEAKQKSNEAEKDSTGVGPAWSHEKIQLLQTLEKRISRVDSILSTPSDVPTLASLCKEPVGQPGARSSELLHMAQKAVERESLEKRNDGVE